MSRLDQARQAGALPPADEGAHAISTRAFAGRATMTVAVAAATMLANVAAAVISARLLGVRGRGQLAVALAVPQLVGWSAALGCQQAISVRQALTPRQGGQLLTSWLIVLVPLSILAVGVSEVALAVTFPGGRGSGYQAAQLYAGSAALVVLAEPFYALVLGDHDFNFHNAARLAQPLLSAILYAILWRLGDFSLTGALASVFVATTLSVAACALRTLRRHPPARTDRSFVRSTIWYGVRAHAADTLSTLTERLDLLIVSDVLGASSAGLYAVAGNLAGVMLGIFGALSLILVPAAARTGPRLVMRSIQVAFALGLSICVALELLAPALVRIMYGRRFADSVTPLRILLPGVLLLTLVALITSGLYAADRPLTASLPYAAGVVTTVVGLALFLAAGGIVAAAIVSSVAYTAAFLVAIRLYSRVMHKSAEPSPVLL